MKAIYDNHHADRQFAPGTWVYVCLHPYKQMTSRLSKHNRLSPRYFGPYQVLQRIGQVAYKLQLPTGSKIHDVFHVSLLKEKVSEQVPTSSTLPTISPALQCVHPRPAAILHSRVNGMKPEILVQWEGLPPSAATWEPQECFETQSTAISFLEDKKVLKAAGMIQKDEN